MPVPTRVLAPVEYATLPDALAACLNTSAFSVNDPVTVKLLAVKNS